MNALNEPPGKQGAVQDGEGGTYDVIPTNRVIITAKALRLPWTSAFFNHDAIVRTMNAAAHTATMTMGARKRGFLK